MVVLFTNESNPFALKALVASGLGQIDLELKLVDLQDPSVPEPKRLPYLQQGDDILLFSSNAQAASFFPQQSTSFVGEWLEFESTVLAPTAALALTGGSKSPELKNKLVACLKVLDTAVTTILDLNGRSVTVSDVAIWSTLYPCYKNGPLANEYFADFPALLKWLVTLESITEFQKALNQYKVAPEVSSYQILLASQKFLSPTLVSLAPSPVESVTAAEVKAAKEAWLADTSRIPKVKEQCRPVLPVRGERNVLITSALPYVNNVPHLGNIIGCVLSADVFARYSRQCNNNTLFICGTDEYGTATETKALEEGLTPQQVCDKYFEVHNAIYRWFNIGFDHFGRTSTPEQTKITQAFFTELNRNGFMQTQPVEQLLCEKCNRYLADRFVEGGCPHPGCGYEDARGDQCDGCSKLVNAAELKNPRCKVCGSSPVKRTSAQFFLDLPKLEPLLRHWMERSALGWSHNASVIGRTWLKEGLKPRCITRDLKWGVPVPLDGYRDKVFYVWFDAPLGYISITKRYTDKWEQWWKPDKDVSVTLYQFMAKDNVPFHSVMFPATLLGINRGHTMVSHIMATEYLNYEDGKFSKSRGIGVFGNDARDTGIPSDVWRFYLLYVRPEGQDSSFSWSDLATKNNSELLNNLGNFVNRALVFTEKFFASTVPPMALLDDDYMLLALCRREIKGYVEALEKARLRDGIRHILSISRHGNHYMQSTQPWVLLKGSDAEKSRAGTIIGLCTNLTCLLATLLFPYMPETSRTIRKQLNAPETVAVISPENPEVLNLLQSGHVIGKPAPLFAKIEPETLEQLKKRFGGKQQTNGIKLDRAYLEAAVAKQADKVRVLKASTKDKTVWQPEVATLLDLKKKLEQCLVSTDDVAPTPPAQNGLASDSEIERLQESVDQQALLVRKLKESGAAKDEWQPQVALLLDYKAMLAKATGEPAPASAKSKKGKK